MFTHIIRVLATVPRWAIVPTLRQQSVAEHSYYVSLYMAEMLSMDALSHWDSDRKFAALRAALIHDAPEALMSDIPGPVKRRIRDEDAYHQFEQEQMDRLNYTDRHGYQWHTDDDIDALIKVADLIDEYFYLRMERLMGNGILERIIPEVQQRLHNALAKCRVFSQSEREEIMVHVLCAVQDLDRGEIAVFDEPPTSDNGDIPF